MGAPAGDLLGLIHLLTEIMPFFRLEAIPIKFINSSATMRLHVVCVIGSIEMPTGLQTSSRARSTYSALAAHLNHLRATYIDINIVDQVVSKSKLTLPLLGPSKGRGISVWARSHQIWSHGCIYTRRRLYIYSSVQLRSAQVRSQYYNLPSSTYSSRRCQVVHLSH